VEKPAPEDAPSHLFIVGRYLLSPRVMELLATQGPGAGGEIQLTDAMQRLLAEEEMYALVVDPAEGCDTGTPAAWAATNARMALADPDSRGLFLEALGNKAIEQLR
jgi:UTP--glucose-1-phosphate uridylyltransferase